MVVRFDSVDIREIGDDRVLISGTRGEPAPESAKALLTYPGGYRNSMTFAITGVDRAAKVELAERALWAQTEGGRESFGEVRVETIGADLSSERHDDQTYLRVSVADTDRRKVGRAFSSAAVATALGSYPGLYLTTPPGDASEFLVPWPTLVPATHAVPRLQVDGAEVPVPEADRRPVSAPGDAQVLTRSSPRPQVSGETTTTSVSTIVGARSGDKGGNANLGLWVRDQAAYDWLVSLAHPANIAEILPSTADLDIHTYLFPKLRAVNVVIVGLLGRGVAASLREDPQAKALGEQFRALRVPIPETLLAVGEAPPV
ncbi:acyclic terpene utilization AtuA family protein [Gordonia terrae]